MSSSLILLSKFENGQCCVFCRSSIIDPLSCGPVYQYKHLIAHYFCLLLSSNIRQNGRDTQGILGFLQEDIEREVARGKKLSCSYCRKKGALIGCGVKSCKTMFHLPCGISKQALSLYYDRFTSYCYKHRSWINFPDLEGVQIESKTCSICLENLSLPMGNITWSTCCKNAWYHKRCIQEVALNSGYYFRCPICNNESIFRNQMLEFGIYIPNQDASWEQEPNAYSGVYERYSHCDAVTCYCPWGRDTCHRAGAWQIVLCYRCLQKGIHKKCSMGTVKRDLWCCSSQTCLNESSSEDVEVPETSSGITTQNLTLPSSSCENKENFALHSNSGDLSNRNYLHRRSTVEVFNATSVTEHRQSSFSSILCSQKECFSGRETLESSSFAFNLPPVNSVQRPAFAQLLRRRSLRFNVTSANHEDEKTKRNAFQKNEKCNQPKKNVGKNSTRYSNMRLHRASNHLDLIGRRRRRRFLIDKRVVFVYPAIMKCIKNFEITL
ncbi:PHD finger protein 7-like [Planococcus citri]|uniref:PHD finger protein 7-like n=1 Tax=Planococcus citri TaxID=170843 RepID=UPI0031F9463C